MEGDGYSRWGSGDAHYIVGAWWMIAVKQGCSTKRSPRRENPGWGGGSC